MLQPPWARWLVAVSLVAVAYITAGKFGLLLAGVHPSATAVWPPTGIAIAALLIGSKKWWPGVFVGAFVTNVTTAGSVATSLGIATGNTLEAVVAAVLVTRFANGRATFDRGVDVLKYAVLAAGLATTISATIGVTTLYLGGLLEPASTPSVWGTWWLGDLEGTLIVAPAILIWTRPDQTTWTRARIVEAIILTIVAVGVGLTLFSPFSAFGDAALPLGFLLLPIVLWPAVRLGRHATISIVVLLSAIALAGTVAGGGPFHSTAPANRLPLLQTFLATVSLVGLGLAATVAERQSIERALRTSQRELEDRVAERTASLASVVRALEKEAEDRERVHAELQVSERQLVKAHEMANLGSWQWDYTTNVVEWSPQLYKILGLDPDRETPSFERYMALVHPDDLEEVEAASGGAVADRVPMQIGYRIIRDDGDVRHVRVWGDLMPASPDRASKYAGVVQDVTDQVHAAKAKLEAAAREHELQRLKEADAFRSHLLGAVSHELKTPLTPLKLQLHMLESGLFGGLNERQNRAITILDRNLSRLALLVDQTLDIARIEGGQLVLDRKPTNVSVVLHDTAEAYEEAARAAKVNLVTDIQPELHAEADPNRLAQVLFNLLSNAIKFTDPDGTVRVKAFAENAGVTVEVTDSGAGIEPEDQASLFRPFGQLSEGARPHHGGTGLGLFISRGIVEAHGGEITATSEGKGRGTTFRFWIPSSPNT